MENFRPNIVCDGHNAYAEDSWDCIEFESDKKVVMNIVKPCARCSVPTIDPQTGIFDPNNEPTRTIKKFRSGSALGFRKSEWAGEVRKFSNIKWNLQMPSFLSSISIVFLLKSLFFHFYIFFIRIYLFSSNFSHFLIFSFL